MKNPGCSDCFFDLISFKFECRICTELSVFLFSGNLWGGSYCLVKLEIAFLTLKVFLFTDNLSLPLN